jgi:hypothetical protein
LRFNVLEPNINKRKQWICFATPFIIPGITDSIYSYLQKHVNPMAARVQNKGRGRRVQAGRAFDSPIKLFNYIQIGNEEN